MYVTCQLAHSAVSTSAKETAVFSVLVSGPTFHGGNVGFEQGEYNQRGYTGAVTLKWSKV